VVGFAILVLKDFQRNRCLEKSSSLGFQTILSVVPVLVLSLIVLRALGASGAFGGGVTRVLLHELNIDRIVLTVPASASSPAVTFKLGDTLQRIVGDADDALLGRGAGLASIFGIVFAAVLMAREVEFSMNSIWRVSDPGTLLHRIAFYGGVTALLPPFVGLAIYAGGLFPPAAFLNAPVGVLVPFAAFFALYRFVPATKVDNLAALLGAALAAVAWHVAKYGFSLYLLTAAGYGTLYGVLGLLPIFTVWIWLGWTIVLAGAETAYVAQNRPR
jgi:membrane protein